MNIFINTLDKHFNEKIYSFYIRTYNNTLIRLMCYCIGVEVNQPYNMPKNLPRVFIHKQLPCSESSELPTSLE